VVTGAEPPAPAATAPLRGLWYYAAPGGRIRPGRTVAKTLLGEPVLLGRDATGAPFALRDVCPHRAMPLRYGRFDGREIECCYHGWRFDPTGSCTAVPSLVAGQRIRLDRIRVKAYPVREQQGGLWLLFGSDPAAAPPPPRIEGIPDDAVPGIVESMRFSCGIDDAVVGLMDPAHGPFVHEAWWWRTRGSAHEKAKEFVPAPYGFTMRRHPVSRNSRLYRVLGGAPETEITYRLPGVRIEHVSVGPQQFCNLTAVTPIDDASTEITHAVYWTAAWLSALKPLTRGFARAFLRQDRDVMAKQQEGLRHTRPQTLIDDADTQAKWYHRMKAEFLRSQAEGRAFRNPVEPRTLRWRS
jgi:phenylpropionate dioxygenase-like ring-hydroxylating dioxygenase large terminal subunit